MKKLYPTERQTQQAIIGYLKYKGWYVQRMNSGIIPSIYKGKTRLIQLSEKGTPDIMAFKLISAGSSPALVLLFVEVKAHGNKPTQAQHDKMIELQSFGATCIVAYSIDALERVGI